MQMEGLSAAAVTQNAYQYNGIERNTDFGLNLDLAVFRTYDPSIGRWIQVDPLSEIAPELNGYRNAFNNPVNFVDPLGLFETRREAREYRRDNDIKGKIVKNREGRYEIRNRKSSGYIMRTEDGNIEAGAVGYGSFIRQTEPKEPNFAEKVRNSGFLGKLFYGMADPIYVFAQDMNPLDTDLRHLDQTEATYSDRQEALAGTGVTVLPILRGLRGAQNAMPQGLTIFNRLNAA
jgi:RHS repeat-associated protein